MEGILMVTSRISEFMEHTVSTFVTLVIHCVTGKPGFAALFLGWFLLTVVALVRQRQ